MAKIDGDGIKLCSGSRGFGIEFDRGAFVGLDSQSDHVRFWYRVVMGKKIAWNTFQYDIDLGKTLF